MDFQSAMETFAEAWVAANAGQQTQALALTRSKSPSVISPLGIAVKKENSPSPQHLSSIAGGGGGGSLMGEPKTQSLETSSSEGKPQAQLQHNPLHQHQHMHQQQQHQQQQHHHHLHSHQHQQQQQQQLLQHQQQLQQQQISHPHHHHHHQQQQQQPILHPSFRDESRSPRYQGATSVSTGGRQSSDASSPVSSEIVNSGNAPTSSSQNHCNAAGNVATSSATPKMQIPSAINEVMSSTVGNSGAIVTPGIGCQPMPSSLATPQQSHSVNEKLLPSPSPIDRREFDLSKANAKSLPLHCIVESVHSLQASLTIDTRNPWKRRPNIETDSYVIVAASTPWVDIVGTALQRLGYSLEVANTARGSLIIKNWKAIPLESISDNPVVPVCDILGELTSVVTLRIVILRAKPSTFGEIKDKLLKLLVLQSHALLRSTGCPLDEVTLSHICRSSYQNSFAFPGGEIGDDLRRKFDQWWSNQLSPQSPITPNKMLPFMAVPSSVGNEMDFPVGTAAVAAAAAAAAAAHVGLHNATVGAGGNGSGGASSAVVANVGVGGGGISLSRESLLMDTASGHHGGPASVGAATGHHPNMLVHPAIHHSMHHHHHSSYPNQKTRMRTSFDPEMELPKLQKWFQENPHPSRQQIQAYVVQLNSLESRRGRKPLDVNNVVYWFKNARAAQKRAEMRGGSGGGGLGPVGGPLGQGGGQLGHHAINGYMSHHHHGHSSAGTGSGLGSVGSSIGPGGIMLSHDYLKSPLSLKSEDIDTMSQHSDDLDDDNNNSRPSSPQLPLSLTTHERNRSSPEEDESILQQQQQAILTSAVKDEEENADAAGERTSVTLGATTAPLNGCVTERASDSHENKNPNNVITNGDNRVVRDDTNDVDNRSPRDTAEAGSRNHSTVISNNSSSNNNNNNNNSNTNSNQSALEQQSDSPKNSSKSEDLDMDEDDDNDISQMDDFRTPSPSDIMTSRKDSLTFPIVPNSMFSQSFMYMSHYMPGFVAQPGAHHHHHHHNPHHAAAAAAAAVAGIQPHSVIGSGGGINLSGLSSEERRKRNRTFIDPVTEVPKLEQWFAMNTHPSHNLILKYTEDLNTMPYRQKFPRLESKNVQFWFKNRRAKCKRLKMSLYDTSQCAQLTGLNSYVHKYDERE